MTVHQNDRAPRTPRLAPPARRWLWVAAAAIVSAVLVQTLLAVTALGRATQTGVVGELGSQYALEILEYFAIQAAASAVVAVSACAATLACRPSSSPLKSLLLVATGMLGSALAAALVITHALQPSVFQAVQGATQIQALLNWPQLVAFSTFPTAAAAWALRR
ncbi:hypothetical protein H9Y04_44080 [Streptomyces sp. TRM66268-LWL]|uniref:Uncharacterized protein n=1 Tax=Streptomyces polyasparticus TaxID=2767826 RepID=A0ABR7SY70_9ACTN|nr:hypothetical protein [Streptomyces polyasparticus]MBC9719501.1 hypothetical protein [Streptomyces polyasparticus]